MLKESIKSPIFTDGFRLIDLLSVLPPHGVVLSSPNGSGKNLTESNRSPQRCLKNLTKVKKAPGRLEQLANFPSKSTQVAGGKREAAGSPSTVNAPGTRVCVRAQKCLCPAQLAQLPCARTACAHTQLICESAVRSACAVKMSSGANPHNTAWRDLLTSKGLSGTALVSEGYGLSFENDLSLLVQEDLN